MSIFFVDSNHEGGLVVFQPRVAEFELFEDRLNVSLTSYPDFNFRSPGEIF